jgi:hypothetical protein
MRVPLSRVLLSHLVTVVHLGSKASCSFSQYNTEHEKLEDLNAKQCNLICLHLRCFSSTLPNRKKPTIANWPTSCTGTNTPLWKKMDPSDDGTMLAGFCSVRWSRTVSCNTSCEIFVEKTRACYFPQPKSQITTQLKETCGLIFYYR